MWRCWEGTSHLLCMPCLPAKEDPLTSVSQWDCFTHLEFCHMLRWTWASRTAWGFFTWPWLHGWDLTPVFSLLGVRSAASPASRPSGTALLHLENDQEDLHQHQGAMEAAKCQQRLCQAEETYSHPSTGQKTEQEWDTTASHEIHQLPCQGAGRARPAADSSGSTRQHPGVPPASPMLAEHGGADSHWKLWCFISWHEQQHGRMLVRDFISLAENERYSLGVSLIVTFAVGCFSMYNDYLFVFITALFTFLFNGKGIPWSVSNWKSRGKAVMLWGLGRTHCCNRQF